MEVFRGCAFSSVGLASEPAIPFENTRKDPWNTMEAVCNKKQVKVMLFTIQNASRRLISLHCHSGRSHLVLFDSFFNLLFFPYLLVFILLAIRKTLITITPYRKQTQNMSSNSRSTSVFKRVSSPKNDVTLMSFQTCKTSVHRQNTNEDCFCLNPRALWPSKNSNTTEMFPCPLNPERH